MTTRSRIDESSDQSGLDDRKLSRAFLLLSLPFGVLFVVTLITVWILDFDRETAGVVMGDVVERRQQGLMDTPPEDAAALIAVMQVPQGPWDEDQVAALRRLLVRTGWPNGSDAEQVVTNSRLTSTAPSEWNPAERAVAVEIVREFERAWFSHTPR
ncbi:hypothetical protein [Engelhardtia mirabilis]|uniref:Uncharacterized protein n=1 Tax=Engelhardtia mirabilis TaxID=2528011 RepID=A0A518BHP7_9BACT|nr:hypothetical protein Pla133_15840 [Planctomycetes bacterium Pla133]QDV00836.1 hypothetical protein Pla86_15830 [Planctomycetes bacterium Pla86]